VKKAIWVGSSPLVRMIWRSPGWMDWHALGVAVGESVSTAVPLLPLPVDTKHASYCFVPDLIASGWPNRVETRSG
jgi:hypothetical protein